VRARVVGIAAACQLACSTAPPAEPPRPPAGAAAPGQEAAGFGRFLTALPAGETGPANRRGQPVRPKVTAEFAGPPATNKWWSSLIWQFDADGRENPFSENLYPHPLGLRARAEGLAVGYPAEAEVQPRRYTFALKPDLVLGVEGLQARAARVESYSDFAVTAAFDDQLGSGAGGAAARALRATFGRGLPFVYVTVRGGAATLAFPDGEAPVVWSDRQGTLGLTVHGHHFGVFAPPGASWSPGAARGTLRSTLAGKDFYSVAVLPDASPATLALFRRHAYAFVTDTRVSWRYDAASARVETRFTVETTAKESGPDLAAEPLLALYRHQWLHTDAPLLPLQYASPRGAMKLHEGATFTTRLPFGGVLPALPLDAASGAERARLLRDLALAARADDPFPLGPDGKRNTYWEGRSLARLAGLLPVAAQLGPAAEKDRRRLLALVKDRLADWFDGVAPRLYAYDPVWHTLVGLPAGFGSIAELNDHHFHYGYFVYAAAMVAACDPPAAGAATGDWSRADGWGGLVRLLIKDAANWDRQDRRFPFLRNFDAYAGHAWASGAAPFRDGNNQESSSEEMNFAGALVLYGAVAGETAIRDLGVFLYATAESAIEQYWFDVDRQVFPRGFEPPMLGIVWDAGGQYDTWWDRNPIYAVGINLLPITGGSLYLGRRPADVQARYDRLVRQNGGDILQWRDLFWMYLALADAPRAASLLDRQPYFEPEFGDSAAFLDHWLAALGAIGQVDGTVHADGPLGAAFRKGAQRTYVAFNPGALPARVRFSDGGAVDVRAGALAAATATLPALAGERDRR
jgi:endoglucanase Acf2